MVPAAVAAHVAPVAALWAGAFAWFAAMLLTRRLTRRQRVVVGVLIALGITGMVWGVSLGQPLEWRLALTANQPLISMLAAVSFLRLVTTTRTATSAALTGRAGVGQTMLTVHLLGAVINIPAIDTAGDRFLARGRLSKPHLLLLSRSFSAAAFWSPFWGAAAAVLTYASDADLPLLMMFGAMLAAVGLSVSALVVVRAFGQQVDDFVGLPLSVRAMAVPLAMVALVLGIHVLNPQIPVVWLITACAPAVAVCGLALQGLSSVPRRLASHAREHLPAMAGELTLFLAAGVLIAGFMPLTNIAGLDLTLEHFSWWHAWVLVGVMTLLSGCGLHPVVSIALSASLLNPVGPDATLFAMAGLIAWGLQAAGGPSSGLNVVLHGRYGVDSFRLAQWNIRYVLLVLGLAGPTLWLCDLIT